MPCGSRGTEIGAARGPAEAGGHGLAAGHRLPIALLASRALVTRRLPPLSLGGILRLRT